MSSTDLFPGAPEHHVTPSVPEPTPEEAGALEDLYANFGRANLIPLWTEIADLMPMVPTPKAVPHVWAWNSLYPLAERAGELVPVGRGGERRAIALANPGLGGTPYATPTLWAAIQYLGGRETAPEHRHSQNAFRFVVEGEGVWTVVNGDPVAMRRGDFLLTPGWNFHGHHNDTDQPMAWIDGLDIPLVHYLDTGFFEYGTERVTDEATPDVSRSERLWAYPGLRPLSGLGRTVNSPIAAYRWEYTDAALRQQLLLEDEGQPATVSQGHAAVRFSNPTTGGDVMPTIRAQFHRLRAGTSTSPLREVGSSVWQVFEGRGEVVLDGVTTAVEKGDLFVVPSWCRWSLNAESEFDLFHFSDAPLVERLHFDRSFAEGDGR
ncbi:cupin domain-containing protein [Arthrobacter sp. NPDC090010]|uniref:cupin domain-containing protein n=1 Tax=Arthrobacter sp. NPDC090010 TaxID=3363942 RepID=UPI0038074377